MECCRVFGALCQCELSAAMKSNVSVASADEGATDRRQQAASREHSGSGGVSAMDSTTHYTHAAAIQHFTVAARVSHSTPDHSFTHTKRMQVGRSAFRFF